jgi:hypothetical protein
MTPLLNLIAEQEERFRKKFFCKLPDCCNGEKMSDFYTVKQIQSFHRSSLIAILEEQISYYQTVVDNLKKK